MANTKLNKRVQEELVNAIMLGETIENSIKRVGISHKTYYNWINRGRSAPATSPFSTFYKQITLAHEAQFETHLENIKKAGLEGVREITVERVLDKDGNVVSEKQTTRMADSDWRASKAYLELRAPDRFRRRAVEHEHMTDDSNKLNIHLHFDDGERDERADGRHIIDGESTESERDENLTQKTGRIEVKPDKRETTQ